MAKVKLGIFSPQIEGSVVNQINFAHKIVLRKHHMYTWFSALFNKQIITSKDNIMLPNR